MGFWKIPGAVEKGLDVVSKAEDLIDKGFLTKQEAAEGFRKYFELTLNENTDRSKARRVIAVATIRFFFVYFGITALFYIAAIFGRKMDIDAKFLMDIGNVLKDLAIEFQLHYLVGMVYVFFFGTYLAGKLKGAQ